VIGRRRLDLVALATWAWGVWILLTWTLTLEQLTVGAGVAVLTAVSLYSLGPVTGPWWFLTPRRLWHSGRLILSVSGRVLVANLGLARRIWSPRRPLTSGMVILPTRERTDGGLTAVALITSLIVDNQIVDLDRAAHLMQYHAVSVPPGDAEARRAAVNGPVEQLLAGLRHDDEGGRDD
jgi:multicomponent Na+:H+ antiporter subunit E